jgi:cytoskeleton protein RodZ
LDDVEENAAIVTAGEQLRAAREAQGMTLDTVAATTRIPTRHLLALENGEWSTLPAPTYTIGFAKNYATVVGLDRAIIADQLRMEMGGTRPQSILPEVFQPADPKRSMPKWLIVGAVIAVLIVLAVLSFLRNRELDPAVTTTPAAAQATDPGVTPAATTAPAPAPAAVPTSGQVSLAATTSPVWIRVRDNGRTIKETTLQPGERFDIPATATAPILDAGRPEGLSVTVAGKGVPPIGKSGRPVSKVSLRPADLAKGGAASTTGAAPTANPTPPVANSAGTPAIR